MSRIMSFAVSIAAVASLLLSPYSEAAPPPKPRSQVGRYQLVVGPNSVYVIDTATAHCWSRGLDGRWVHLGTPFDPQQKRTPAPLSLKLPNEPVEMTILQRRSKPIPGAEDRIFLQVEDITAGQVLLSVRADEGEVLLDDTSIKPGKVARFTVADKTFYVRLRELTNVLLGSNDFGVFEVWSNPPPVEAVSEDEGGDEKSGATEDSSIKDADTEDESESSA